MNSLIRVPGSTGESLLFFILRILIHWSIVYDFISMIFLFYDFVKPFF